RIPVDGQQQVWVLGVGALCALAGGSSDVVAVPRGDRYVVGVGIQPAGQSLGGGSSHVPFHHHAGGTRVISPVAGVHGDGVGRVPYVRAEQLVRFLQGALLLKSCLLGLPPAGCLPQFGQSHRCHQSQSDQLPVDLSSFSMFCFCTSALFLHPMGCPFKNIPIYCNETGRPKIAPGQSGRHFSSTTVTPLSPSP